ncbi:MAG: hypothetical protein F7C35_08410 [Desulfurococcales archaeon]|nr:hypothetical protein [Desulfurococcales archaeon]
MVLRHKTVKTVRALPEQCVECILRVDRLLSTSKHTHSIERVAENVYHVKFVWRKLGMTKYFDVVFRVEREGNKIRYRSIEGSRYPMIIEFTLKPKGDVLEIEVYSEMKAGLMADLLGRKDYAKFIEDLVETGIAKLLTESSRVREREEGEVARCDKCILYDPVRGYCYFLRRPVINVIKPPCGGRDFIPYT